MSKPIWYAEKANGFWLIRCRFMLGTDRAELAEALFFDAGIEMAPGVITQMNIRRERFIAEEPNHA